ncbi:binding-protein-dependent transport system inner membrane component family protein (plasmid) [Ochrobactrum quorumnocens]|uniref:Binding-protein-dependent transport system inner membrane component family protein n=1 Tax=Ochrobactrum quorumnocens TaxID=271865 RepID=A0A248UN14_9HYPH|nr:ABC transporter permease [[Ochrobactrum] quorumnocens]ASV87791.1 binding-protein-dependent transport system inner membrane component family protein [[Ochrobactrum] quorumnocens]
MENNATNVASTVWKEKDALIDRIPRPVAIFALGLSIVGIWHLVTLSGWLSIIILPTPWMVFDQIITVGLNIVTGGYMLKALWVTTQEVLAAFVIASAIGIVLGIIVGETKFGALAVMPYLVAIDTMPKIAFAPLFVAWMGFGLSSKIALAVFVSVFPVIVGTASGLQAADEDSRQLYRIMRASRWQTLIGLKFPTGLPQIFTGLKIAALSVMAGAITAEFLGGGKGFGELIRVAASQLDTARVFALIIYLSLVGLAMFGIVAMAERKIIFWKSRSAGE